MKNKVLLATFISIFSSSKLALAASPYRFDDSIRYACDLLSYETATLSLTEKAVNAGFIRPGDTFVPASIDEKKQILFAQSARSMKIEQIHVSTYWGRGLIADEIVTCAGHRAPDGSIQAHVISGLDLYTNVVWSNEIESLSCVPASSTNLLKFLLVKNKLEEALFNDSDIQPGCRIENRSLRCDKRDIEINLSKKEIIPPNLLARILEFVGTNPLPTEVYVGKMNDGFLNLGSTKIYCY